MNIKANDSSGGAGREYLEVGVKHWIMVSASKATSITSSLNGHDFKLVKTFPSLITHFPGVSCLSKRMGKQEREKKEHPTLQSHHGSNPAFTSSVTSRSPATVGKAISTHGLPQVQSLGGKGFGGPAGGNKDLSGYLGILIKGLSPGKATQLFD